MNGNDASRGKTSLPFKYTFIFVADEFIPLARRYSPNMVVDMFWNGKRREER
jgi:hypothetical protein